MMEHSFLKRHRPGGAHDKADLQKRREERERQKQSPPPKSGD